MRLLFITFADSYHGLGHWHRTQAVISEAKQRNHKVLLAGNYKADVCLEHIDDKQMFLRILEYFCPDWVIIDILEPLPAYIPQICHSKHMRIAMLNGIGRKDGPNPVDIIWAQDTPQKAILRPEILSLNADPSATKTLVWGGAADELNLCNTYTQYISDPAWVITTRLSRHPVKSSRVQHAVLEVQGEEIFEYLIRCRRAVVHLGMLVWECAYLGVPVFMFSRSVGHLHDAAKFEKLGYGYAYPNIGLPDEKRFVEFLKQDVVFDGVRPDGLGAKRFIEALETQ